MISVVIPCYNYGHLIGETIESVLSQSYHDIELIIIDDGSTDNTGTVVKNYEVKDARVRYFYQANSGLAFSRNKGITEAKGQFFQFLDADDLIEPDKFRVELLFFQNNPALDIVYSSVRYFTNDPYNVSDRRLTYWGPDKEWMPKLSGKGRDILATALIGNFSHLSSPLFRRQIVEKVGMFDNTVSAVADYHFLLRCAINDAYFQYHDTLNTYSLVRWHPDNMSRNVHMMHSEERKMRILLADFLNDHPEAKKNNEDAITVLTYMTNNSWKKKFLSGGKFDLLKKPLQRLGLSNLFKKLFYKNK